MEKEHNTQISRFMTSRLVRRDQNSTSHCAPRRLL